MVLADVQDRCGTRRRVRSVSTPEVGAAPALYARRGRTSQFAKLLRDSGLAGPRCRLKAVHRAPLARSDPLGVHKRFRASRRAQ